MTAPTPLVDRLKAHRQEHVLRWWHELSPASQNQLTRSLDAIDLVALERLFASRDAPAAHVDLDRIADLPVLAAGDDADAQELGAAALRRGEVAVLVVAGGQGTRLGFDQPKGMYPIGPVTQRSLFQIHAERVQALGRCHGRPLPFLVMTSPATHDETVAFFDVQGRFGIAPDDVHFFCQGTMPALELATGRLLMDDKQSLALSPNGHGGTLLALADSGLLDVMQGRGIRHVFYFQVDNPLVRIADPVFLGQHLRANAEVSTKAIAKNGPLDKLGNLVSIDGRCTIIEYSDLPEAVARQTDAAGRLRIRVGNPAIHLFDLHFLRRVSTGDLRIPFHVARKKVPYLDDAGLLVEPTAPNALKFEMFIFDVLPRAERWIVVETDRSLEFHPLKNAEGPDSPATVRQALSNEAGRRLNDVGVEVARTPTGDVAAPLELSLATPVAGPE